MRFTFDECSMHSVSLAAVCGPSPNGLSHSPLQLDVKRDESAGQLPSNPQGQLERKLFLSKDVALTAK
jgi:hypothetical protein